MHDLSVFTGAFIGVYHLKVLEIQYYRKLFE